eukprot:2896844-Pleurochrysis_carterae.AAC.1
MGSPAGKSVGSADRHVRKVRKQMGRWAGDVQARKELRERWNRGSGAKERRCALESARVFCIRVCCAFYAMMPRAEHSSD